MRIFYFYKQNHNLSSLNNIKTSSFSNNYKKNWNHLFFYRSFYRLFYLIYSTMEGISACSLTKLAMSFFPFFKQCFLYFLKHLLSYYSLSKRSKKSSRAKALNIIFNFCVLFLHSFWIILTFLWKTKDFLQTLMKSNLKRCVFTAYNILFSAFSTEFLYKTHEIALTFA